MQKKGSWDYEDIQDTYDIASVLNGDWYGVNGSGLATGVDETYNVIMSSINLRIIGVQVTNNNLTGYLTHRQLWNCYDKNRQFVTRLLLYRDNSNFTMTRIGANMWEAKGNDGSFLIMQFISETTAIVTQETTENIRGRDYHYYVIGTIQKRLY